MIARSTLSFLLLVLFISGCQTGTRIARNPTASNLTYDLLLSDPKDVLGTNRQLFLENFAAAIGDWARFIRGNGKLNIKIQFDSNTPGGHFDTIEPNKVFLREDNGLKIYVQSGTYKLQTGRAAKEGEPDILIRIQPEYFIKECWLDPDPRRRVDPIPRDKTDLITLFAHELGHGFGIDGLRDTLTGTISNGEISLFDSMIMNPDSRAPTFAGPYSRRVYGHFVPLTRFATNETVFLRYRGVEYKESQYASQSFYHYGRFAAEKSESELTFHGLMAGVWLNRDDKNGLRLKVSPLDAAMVHDLGVPLAEQ